ncbi:glutaredoxin family protein [Salinispira pacifica]
MNARLLTLVLAAAVFVGCASDPHAAQAPAPLSTGQNAITVYGRPSCANCESLRRSLERNGVAYLFRDVDADQAANSEMWQKIRSTGAADNSVILPVVEVNGVVLVTHPTSVDQLRPYLR